VITATLGPVRERALELLESPDTLDEILAEGARRARERAGATLERVYDRVGFLPSKR
jgi:tryptophanyl-tRNA synthetase